MKRTRRYLAALLTALFILGLAGCSEDIGSGESSGTATDLPAGEDNTAAQGNGEDFQKNCHQTEKASFLKTDAGYYFSYSSLYFIDPETQRAAEVCAKPDCDHTDDAICNARIHADYLLKGGDRIYFVGYGNDPKEVSSVKLDASGRETVQELKFNEFSNAQSSRDEAIYHRGYLYYISDDILYRVKLGGEKDSAETIWSPEDAGSTQSHGNLVDFNPNAIRYTLWADGDSLYFMANVQTTDGTYKDVLFQCGLDGSDVHQVWATPDADQVGEWEETGVSVGQWYVTGGSIYFYLSGNDYYRTDLATGKTEKLADTHEQTQYGSAIFSDNSLCLLNDEPVNDYADRTLELGSHRRSNGDAIFVYGMDGTFRQEISLTGLFEELGNVAYIDLLLCDESDVYFAATTMTFSTQPGMSVGNKDAVMLCRANFETGEAYAMYRLN